MAIRTVCVLDKFIEDCAKTVSNDEYDSANGVPQAPLPSLQPFPEDASWRSVKQDLMYRILSMPNAIYNVEHNLFFVLSAATSENDQAQYFSVLKEKYTALGLTAAKLSQDIRDAYKIPERDAGEWDPVRHLEDEKLRLEEGKKSP